MRHAALIALGNTLIPSTTTAGISATGDLRLRREWLLFTFCSAVRVSILGFRQSMASRGRPFQDMTAAGVVANFCPGRSRM
jgi:lysylphosphatidylglycerol synthetase-like protein (DUF2156 family)